MRIEIKDKENFIVMFNEMFYQNKISKINGLSIDSRKIRKNDIYIPIKGSFCDGHDFINDVLNCGASVVFTEKNISNQNNKIIKIKSITELINSLAQNWRKKSKTKIIGITGSNGKTTTKELLYSFLSKKYKCSKSEGNFNSLIGLPLTFLSSRTDDDYCILEYGASKPNEIDLLCKIIKPDYGLITNISESHIANYDSINQLIKTKVAIYKNLIDDDIAFINNDIKCLKDLKYNCKKVTFGFGNNADYKAHSINKNNKNYLKINNSLISIPDSIFHLKNNILSAFSIAYFLNISETDINNVIDNYLIPKGRGNIIMKNNLTIIDDSYNANPASMRLAINRINSMKVKGKKIFVLGDMLELGENSFNLHKNISQFINKSNIDILFTYGNFSEIIHKNIVKSNIDIFYFKKNNFSEMKKTIYLIAEKNDIIYIKASRGMYLERIYKNGESL